MRIVEAVSRLFRDLFRASFGCPECKVRPLKPHKNNCSIGKTDGGYWA